MEKERNKKSQMILYEFAEMVDHSAKKIGLLRDFFSHSVPDNELFSESGRKGFHLILSDLEDDLEFVVDRLFKNGQQAPLEGNGT